MKKFFLILILIFSFAGSSFATTPGEKILEVGEKMVRQAEIVRGSCWDFINKVYQKAGFSAKDRITIFKGEKKKKHLKDISKIQKGDWLYFINHSFNDSEHSGIFIEWVDKKKKKAKILSYGGQNLKKPGRYKTYELSSVYNIIRPREKFSSKKSQEKSQKISWKKGKCSADLILHQNLRAPIGREKYVRNGKYNRYTRGIVKEAHILQKHLNRLGFNAGPVDGIIGPLTRGAILRMQKFLGTKADGYVGPITRGLLNNSCGGGNERNLAKPNFAPKKLELENGQVAFWVKNKWRVEEEAESEYDCTRYENFDKKKFVCYFTCSTEKKCNNLAEKIDAILFDDLADDYDENYREISEKFSENEKNKEKIQEKIDKGLGNNETKNILAVYKVLPGEKYLLIKGKDEKKFQRIKKWLREIFPDKISDKYLKQITLYYDEESDLQAFVNQMEEAGKWGIYINTAFLFEDDEKEFIFTLVHEFSHILSLNDEQVDLTSSKKECSGYFTDEGCLKKNSYLTKFQEKFWKGRNYVEDKEKENYAKDKWDFVTPYAATNPVEDFAESFGSFVFNPKPEREVKGKDMYQKRSFFWNYPELVKIRSTIRRGAANFVNGY